MHLKPISPLLSFPFVLSPPSFIFVSLSFPPLSICLPALPRDNSSRSAVRDRTREVMLREKAEEIILFCFSSMCFDFVSLSVMAPNRCSSGGLVKWFLHVWFSREVTNYVIWQPGTRWKAKKVLHKHFEWVFCVLLNGPANVSCFQYWLVKTNYLFNLECKCDFLCHLQIFHSVCQSLQILKSELPMLHNRKMHKCVNWMFHQFLWKKYFNPLSDVKCVFPIRAPLWSFYWFN